MNGLGNDKSRPASATGDRNRRVDAPAGAAPRRSAPAPVPAQSFAEFAPSTAQADERPFNTGRTLIDARTAEIWRKLTHRAVRALGPEHLGYADPRGTGTLNVATVRYVSRDPRSGGR